MISRNESSFLRRTLAPVICWVTFSMPFAVWFVSTDSPAAYFSAAVPPGQTFYVFSKLFGLLAMVMLWFQAMAALAKDTPALEGFPRLQGRQHAVFGVVLFVVVLVHLSLFVVASTLRTKHSALDLLLPTFEHGYYRAMVGLGAIAFWMLVLVMFAGWRRLRGVVPWRWIHRLGFIVFSLGFLHGITVGSETRFGLMKYVYAFIGLSLGTAVISRLWKEVRRYRRGSFVAHVGPSTSVDKLTEAE